MKHKSQSYVLLTIVATVTLIVALFFWSFYDALPIWMLLGITFFLLVIGINLSYKPTKDLKPKSQPLALIVTALILGLISLPAVSIAIFVVAFSGEPLLFEAGSLPHKIILIFSILLLPIFFFLSYFIASKIHSAKALSGSARILASVVAILAWPFILYAFLAVMGVLFSEVKVVPDDYSF